MCKESKTGHSDTCDHDSLFLSDEVLGGGKNMHVWKAVVEIHELVVSFKTVKEETPTDEPQVLLRPAGVVYIWNPSAQPLQHRIASAGMINLFCSASALHSFPYQKEKEQHMHNMYICWMGWIKLKGQFSSQKWLCIVLGFIFEH